MGSAPRRHWLLLAFGGVTAVATVVVLALAIGAIRHRTVLNRVFDRIELLVTAERFGDDLNAALMEGASIARGPTEWIHLLQYAWQSDSPPTVIARIAGSAFDRHADNELFHHILRYSLVRTGQLDRARALPPLDSTSAVNGELSFLAGTQLAENERYDLLTAAVKEDASATYHLATFYDSQRLFENAALLAAFANDSETAQRARRELDRLPANQRPSPRIALVLAAWSADEGALFSQFERLEGRDAVDPAILLMQGDAYMRQSQSDLAEAVYREVIATDPAYSAVPYLNLSFLRGAAGDFQTAYNVSVAGYERFPDDPRLLVRRVVDLTLLGRGEEAVKVLQEVDFEALHAAVPGAERASVHHLWLLSHALRAVRGPAARFESDLWRYINIYPDADEVAAFLLAYLRFRNDPAGIADLYGRYGNSDSPWATGFAAVESARIGDHAGADQLWEQAVSRSDHWEHLYNAALFAARHYPDQKRSARVDDLYRQARRLGLSDRADAQFIMLRAEMARLSGFPDRAVELALRAIELDPAAESYRAYVTSVAGG